MIFSIPRLGDAVSRLPLPRGVVGIYLFGSARYATDPNDLDILVVYDPIVLSPSQVMAGTESLLCGGIREHWPHGVDLTALTIDEEQTSNFIASEGAISLLSLRENRA